MTNLAAVPFKRLDPLSFDQLRDVYNLTDWRVVLQDKRIERTYNGIPTLGILKVLALPYLVEIPTERALARELQERERVQVICGFIPGEILPTRGTLWNFRRAFREAFPDLMCKILISMVLSDVQPNWNLPFVTSIPESEVWPKEGRQTELRLDMYRPVVNIWLSSPANLSDVQDFYKKYGSAKSLQEVKETLDEYRRAHRKGLSGDLGLPIEVQTKLTEDKTVRFSIDKPAWLDTIISQRDTWSEGGSATLRSYSACNALVRLNVNGRDKILLSKRKIGYGSKTYTLPGGKQKPDETLEECVKREVREETGLIIRKSSPVSLYKARYPGKPEVYSVGVLVEEYEGTLVTKEPDIHDEWQWYDLDDLPDPLFDPTRIAITHFKENKFPNLTWQDVETQIAREEQAKPPQASQLPLLD